MSVALNHTIVWCRDNRRSAAYLAETLGLPAPVAWGPFMIVELDNGVSLDYHAVDDDVEIASQHYAFIVSEDQFDDIYGRIRARNQEHWAEPSCSTPGINRNDGGRGTYFADPDGHLLEIITRPYGSG